MKIRIPTNLKLTMSDAEMKGLLGTVPDDLPEEVRLLGITESFFTSNVFRNMSSEMGMQYARTLLELYKRSGIFEEVKG